MNKEEAIKYAESKKMMLEVSIWNDDYKYGNYAMHSTELSFVNAALTALRPVSREQVEKVWRGKWEWYDEEVGSPIDGIEREWGWRCSKCKVVLPDDFDDPDNPPAMRFCQWCGAPMTDEAMEMVMERWKEVVNYEG